MTAISEGPLPARVPYATERIRPEFQKLAQEWKHSVRHASTLDEMIVHPAYLRVIGFGPDVVPLILAELEQSTDHWFVALHAITGEDPAAGEDDLESAARAWLEWGVGQGHIAECATGS